MNIILSKNARKEYEHLPKNDQVKVRKKLALLEQNPFAGKKLTGELEGVRSLRAWPYRIFYEVNESEQRIEVHKIKHRQGAYKS
ncbi:type II toxin-antitoxin system RelE/ParE family toxin [Candidatus Curtissbacteria bacterium]|nr:type II toxin-antitoxin system RelE/ParE family toxin [Candidatus Curtissbacteria bacterium]